MSRVQLQGSVRIQCQRGWQNRNIRNAIYFIGINNYTVLEGNLGPFIYYLLQSQMYIFFDSANFLLGKFYHKGFLTQDHLFVAALFVVKVRHNLVFITTVLLNALFCVYRMEYYTVLQKSKGILHAHVQNNFQGKISKMQGLQTVLWFCGEDTSVCTCISVHMLQLGTDTEERCSLYTFSLKKFLTHMKMLLRQMFKFEIFLGKIRDSM